MRSKDHLFYLIKSLSKTEKRYFTLDAQKSGRKESRYLELFKVINEQEIYEEETLKKQFGSKLGDDKARLYEAILRAMRDYQSKKSYKTRIKELLTDAKILFERKLYEQSENRLDEAKSLALELQDQLAILEINLRQRQLIKEYQQKDYAEQVALLIEEKEKHLQILHQELWLNDKHDGIYLDILKFPQKLGDEEREALTQRYQDILDYDIDTIDNSLEAQRRYHQIKAYYYRLQGQSEMVYIEFQAVLNLWTINSKLAEENYFSYILDYSNFLAASSKNAERIKNFPALLLKMNKQRPPSIQGEKLLFEKTTIYKLLYLLNSHETTLSSTISEIEQGLRKYKITTSSELIILFNTILILFIADQFEECIKWLKKLWEAQKESANLRQDIQDVSRIIFLLATYKIDDFERIESALRKAKRYFAKRRDSPSFAFFELVLSTITSLQNAVSNIDEKNYLLKLKQATANFNTTLSLGIDEITILWVDSILQNKTIAILRKTSS